HKPINLFKDTTITFIPSGHVPSGCQGILKHKNKSLLYTSDLGNQDFPLAYGEEFEPINSSTVVIGESTYGHNLTLEPPSRCSDIITLRDTIKSCSGRILMPCFSFCRTQEVLEALYQIDEDIDCQVWVDSPLSEKLTKKYAKRYNIDHLLNWKKLHFVDGWEESISLSMNTDKKIVLSSSGMLLNGRITNHLRSIVPCSNDTIVFVGYVAEGTGRAILCNLGVCKIMGEDFEIKCNHIKLNSFSSHATRENLLDYYSSINCDKLYLVHGSKTGKLSLQNDLEEIYYEECKTTKVFVSHKGLEITI
ncbi:MAG: MBL fold metallo-hydrolase, partial [Bacteroidales bacterium]